MLHCANWRLHFIFERCAKKCILAKKCRKNLSVRQAVTMRLFMEGHTDFSELTEGWKAKINCAPNFSGYATKFLAIFQIMGRQQNVERKALLRQWRRHFLFKFAPKNRVQAKKVTPLFEAHQCNHAPIFSGNSLIFQKSLKLKKSKK